MTISDVKYGYKSVTVKILGFFPFGRAYLALLPSPCSALISDCNTISPIVSKVIAASVLPSLGP
jgi:hypothetical protein